MKITEIVLGVAKDGRADTLRFDCAAADLVRVDVDPAVAMSDELARAVRETIAAPERTALCAEVPFVRITARAGDLVLEIADDAGARLRVLTETRAPIAGKRELVQSMPLIIEARHGDEESIDALLLRVALAAGAVDSELLLAALGRELEATSAGNVDEERAHGAAHRRATELAKAVKSIDDKMTQSVVPDWIWIATALGGIGVFMTVVALLYPEYRVIVLPGMIGGSVLGFGAYAAMSFRELKKRGALLEERRELRARRETARAEARAFAARGIALPADTTTELPHDVPLILGGAHAKHDTRQVIVFVQKSV